MKVIGMLFGWVAQFVIALAMLWAIVFGCYLTANTIHKCSGQCKGAGECSWFWCSDYNGK